MLGKVISTYVQVVTSGLQSLLNVFVYAIYTQSFTDKKRLKNL